MFGGLIALLDDVAALAKAAAASLDDVTGVAMKASSKAVGVVIDDTAVTPQYVAGVQPARELPMIWRIVKGSLRNKLFFILPAIVVLSIFVPWIFTPILMLGGAYLSYEGAEKVWHKIHAKRTAHGGSRREAHADTVTGEQPSGGEQPEILTASSPEEAAALAKKEEDRVVNGAITTDLILSCEVMVVAFNQVLHEPLLRRIAVMLVVALVITAGVYGVVALLVKMDDIGVRLVKSGKLASTRAFGRGLVVAMPKVMAAITVIGTVAMLWVGGHLVIKGIADLGWEPLYAFGHHLAAFAEPVPGIGGLLGWLIDTVWAALWGFIVGSIVMAGVSGVKAIVAKMRGALVG